VLTLSLALSGILLFWCFQLGSASMIVPYTLLLSFVAGFVPTSTFTLAPETMSDPRFVGLALGIVSVGQNMGMFFAPPMVGNQIAGGNWAAGVTPLLIAVAIGVVASIMLRARQVQTAEPSAQPAPVSK
jgi:nitrate/nitrite transporter NarK